ncbi:MAG: hypothetical protein CSA50_08115 [Gammaproteobacteria bacterium]|nr:MAG: hypothetical protein CSA50_08115 [Gammaproteobacteria bacterium]
MKKKLITASLLFSFASFSHAGFFDSLFGGDEEKTAAQEETKKVAAGKVQQKQPEATGNMMNSVGDVAMGLLPTLTSQLGVTDTQAKGGMGSLMQLAKSTLSASEFGQLSQGVPGMDTLLAAAPALSGGALGGALSSAGSIASGLGGLGQITKQFEALGLSPDMMVKFATIAVGYFSGNAASGDSSGSSTASLLEKGLSAVLGK